MEIRTAPRDFFNRLVALTNMPVVGTVVEPSIGLTPWILGAVASIVTLRAEEDFAEVLPAASVAFAVIE
jgi:hypothetical protein